MPSHPTPSMHSVKSTTVRIFVATLRLLLGGLSRWAPSLLAPLAARMFLKTRRRRRPERERAWLAGAQRMDLPVEIYGVRRRLAVWSWGRSERIVLLVHGWDGRGSQLGAFVEPLTKAGFRVIAYDAPGHGDSDGKSSSLVEMAEAVREVARFFGPRIHAVIAHSAGSAATSVALSRGLVDDGPSRIVPRLVYLAPPLDLGEFAHEMGRVLGLTTEVVDRMQERIERRFDVRWDDLRGLAIAPEMTAPLMLFHDRDDTMIGWEQGKALAAAWPGAALVPTSGLGHWRILRDREVVRRAVEFMALPEPEDREGEPALFLPLPLDLGDRIPMEA